MQFRSPWLQAKARLLLLAAAATAALVFTLQSRRGSTPGSDLLAFSTPPMVEEAPAGSALLTQVIASPAQRPGVKVLMIGDSLTVGPFGEAMNAFLARRYGRDYALFASCGSSPEHWLRSEPDFYTKCGYREQTPTGGYVRDWVNNHPPAPTRTPKLENLLDRYRPAIVVIQQGTNWMDRLEGNPKGAARDRCEQTLVQLAGVLRKAKSVSKVVWITPPDSSRFSSKIEGEVDSLIRSAARKADIEIIDSGEMTRYIPGKTGGDGVHYRKEASYDWASQVQKVLARKLGEQGSRLQ